MTKPRSIKIDASAKCEICGGEPYVMVRRPKLTMNTSKPRGHHKSSLLCEEHFQKFKNGDLNPNYKNHNYYLLFFGIILVFIMSLFYFLMNNT